MWSPASVLGKQSTAHPSEPPAPGTHRSGSQARGRVGRQAYLDTPVPGSIPWALSPCPPIPQPRRLCLECRDAPAASQDEGLGAAQWMSTIIRLLDARLLMYENQPRLVGRGRVRRKRGTNLVPS